MSTYTVVENKKITPSTQLVTLQRKEGEPLLFQPGQYASIHGYRGLRPMPIRCFSIVSSPTEQDVLQFSMRVRGKFTTAVSGLTEGSSVHVQGPYGGFVLNTHEQKKVILLAGGIGITPFMSMIRFASITETDTKIQLVFSVANQEDVPFKDELLYWQKHNPNFSVSFVVGEGPRTQFGSAHTFEGRVTPETLQQATNVQFGDIETEFYICGPPPFMKALLGMLQSRGVSKSRIMTEAFSQGPNRQTGKIRDWPFSMYALGALGLSAGSMAIMVSDLGKLIPAKDSVNTSATLTTGSSNSRSTDLEEIVNGFDKYRATGKSSPAVKKAVATAKKASQTVATSNSTSSSGGGTSNSGSSSNSSGSTSSGSSGSSSGSSTPSTPPPPVCTTNQSGVTTCI